jgi:anoctamin-1
LVTKSFQKLLLNFNFNLFVLGKQAINTLIEIGVPWLVKKWNKFRYGKQNPNEQDALKTYNQWTKDYKLIAWNTMGLFQEYLEMILQFG